MAERRVAITGLGVVTPSGLGIDALWEALLSSHQGVKTIDLFDPSHFPCHAGGQIDNFSARKFVPKTYRKSVKVMARDIELAVAAADFAFKDSGITTHGMDGEMDIEPGRLGCNIGAGLICTDLDELGMAVNTAVVDGKFDIKAWGHTGSSNLTPLWLLKYLPNMLSCHVTIIHGAEGPSNTITCGDASGHLSVGEGARVIQRGDADVSIAGGAESKVNPMVLLRQLLLKRICISRNESPETACRPFNADHDGTVVGEGGGLLILEDMDRAKSRGAKIYAEMAGFGAACDPTGFDITKSNAGSLDLAVAKAMTEAKITPDKVDMIIAHGTGVAGEDICEAKAWQVALGDAAEKIPAVCITGSIGSLFAGAGGVEMAVAAKAMEAQAVPPTVNFTSAADGCNLNFSSEPRKCEINHIVTAAFSVGGQSAACVFKKVN